MRYYWQIAIAFVLTTLLVVILNRYSPNISLYVTEGCNVLLFVFSLVNHLLLQKTLTASPAKFVNGVMASMLAKLMIFGAAFFILIIFFKSHVNNLTVFNMLFLYLIYQAIDSKANQKAARTPKP